MSIVRQKKMLLSTRKKPKTDQFHQIGALKIVILILCLKPQVDDMFVVQTIDLWAITV